MAIDWDHYRAIRFSKETPPADWPKGVRPISSEGLSLFGIEPGSNKLYWDNREVVLSDRIRLFWLDRIFVAMAGVGTLGYFILELVKFLIR